MKPSIAGAARAPLLAAAAAIVIVALSSCASAPAPLPLDAEALMNQIILIEGVYTNKIQSVIRKLSVGDYNRNNIIADSELPIYNGFTLYPETLGADGLRCQSWAIRRLKCNF